MRATTPRSFTIAGPVFALLSAVGGCARDVVPDQAPDHVPDQVPDQIPDPAMSGPAVEVEAEQRAQRLRDHADALRLPSDEFHVVIEAPFVVIGDEPPATVESRAVRTVRWAVRLLQQEYFVREPDEIIDIWLFKDRDSYERHARLLFGTPPTTPYGYYSARHKALVMNIATGGGTLVHEIVHPFVRANFPDCPAWFNEGLGSLYEQSDERDGRIVGLTNWRLAGLQRAIGEDRVPTFETLTATTNHQFYDEDPGTNYSQARYLCYWLQEHGQLQAYYRAFHAARAEDPTGYRTLQQILGVDDMVAFKDIWQAWVLRLRFG